MSYIKWVLCYTICRHKYTYYAPLLSTSHHLCNNYKAQKTLQ